MSHDEILSHLDGYKYFQRFVKLAKWHRHTPNNGLADAFDQNFIPKACQEKLRVSYVLEQVETCGSTKILLQQANELVKRGHQVTIVCQQPRPTWMPLQADYLQAPWQMDVAQVLPPSDVILCSGASSVIDCYLGKQAPVIHFEQGEIYIFEFDTISEDNQVFFQQYWSIPVARLAVSQGLANVIKKNFNRQPRVIHNALDRQYFYPPEPKEENIIPRILIVGPEQSHFKGIRDILEALQQVRQSGRVFEIVWVTPKPPLGSIEGKVIVNPSQEELGAIYRSCDIYICGSYYESFPLPPLEAMTCGCAVITTDNVGVLEYAEEGVNCLLAKVGDPASLAAALIQLLDDPVKRQKLIQGGYQTAQRFSWDNIIPQLEGYLYSQVEAWRHRASPYNRFTYKEDVLRVETLSKNLNREDAQIHINHVLRNMSEDWCLWLVEGETISNGTLEQLKKILCEEPLADHYQLSIIYGQDITGHSLVRLETRVMKKTYVPTHLLTTEQRLPIVVQGGSASYFLPDWLAECRELYQEQQYEEAFFVLCESLQGNTFGLEKIVIKKWMILVLINLEIYKPAIALVRELLNLDFFYGDITYLFASIGKRFYGEYMAEQIYNQAAFIGDACKYPEYFLNMAELARAKKL